MTDACGPGRPRREAPGGVVRSADPADEGGVGRATLLRLIGSVAALGAVAASPAHAAEPARDVVMVKLDPAATHAEVAEVAHGLDATSSQPALGGWRVYRLDDPLTQAQADAALAGAEAAVRVVVDSPVYAATTPNDPLFPQQWGLRDDNPGDGAGTSADIHVDPVDLSGAAAVTVAVVDTGIDFANPDLAGAAWSNPDPAYAGTHGWDMIAKAPFTTVAPGETHGSHVAGIIAATRDNGVGVAGVAPNARIMAVRFIDSANKGWSSDAALGITWAVDHGATIINGSFGAPGTSSPVCDAVAAAATRGVVFVASAGNNAIDSDATRVMPAGCPSPNVLAVAATNRLDVLASFSNRGATSVDLAAPGESIASTVPGGYGLLSGTSMAAPHVSGAIALLKGLRPAAGIGLIREAILVGSAPRASLAGKVWTGGQLDVAAALDAIDHPATGDTTPPSAPVPTTPDGIRSGSPRVTVRWDEARDRESGIDHYALVVDGVEGPAVSSLAGSATSPELEEGPHAWSVRAVNRAGLVTETTPRTVTVAWRAPVLTTGFLPATGTSVNSDDVRLTWTGGDPGARVVVTVDQTKYIPPDAGALELTGLPKGLHRWSITLTGANGVTAAVDGLSFTTTAEPDAVDSLHTPPPPSTAPGDTPATPSQPSPPAPTAAPAPSASPAPGAPPVAGAPTLSPAFPAPVQRPAPTPPPVTTPARPSRGPSAAARER